MRRPLEVVLDLTERCNLKCVMCYFAETDRLRFAPFDRELAPDGNMPVAVFEQIAADLFPRAWRVALGCAAEPLIHPRFADIVRIAGRHRVPRLWFPTNLLALTEEKADALIDARVRTVAASIDGTTKATYERIRAGAKWERLLEKLEMLREVRRRRQSRLPRLRIIFTWMRSNRHELGSLPAFAAAAGARELDVRFVSPTSGVDVSSELLDREDRAVLNAELATTARDAVARGIRLTSYPEFLTPADRPPTLAGRVARRLWLLKAGLDRPEYWRHAWHERRVGCAFPGRTYVVRPNGAVFPCLYWDREPLGFYPADGLGRFQASATLGHIREGLGSGCPLGTCATCSQRRDALYRPFRVAPGVS